MKRKGQSLVESSLVLASFLGLVLGMAGVSEMLFVRQILADRAHVAARWGALNPYDPQAIRSMVLFGTATPASDASPILGLAPASVVIDNPGCPGSNCRISVTIPEHGIRYAEPVE
ncbi:MAG TPA: TadE family protein [Bryobacteraceae bacterium]